MKEGIDLQWLLQCQGPSQDAPRLPRETTVDMLLSERLKMGCLLMGLTCAQVHVVRIIIFTYPLYGRYIRFITVGMVDSYLWCLLFSSIKYVYAAW